MAKEACLFCPAGESAIRCARHVFSLMHDCTSGKRASGSIPAELCSGMKNVFPLKLSWGLLDVGTSEIPTDCLNPSEFNITLRFAGEQQSI